MNAIFTNYASKLLRSVTLRTAISSLRYKSGREECHAKTGPRCSPEELRKTKCMQEKLAQLSQPQLQTFRGMWEHPECCTEKCRGDFPRFDELYYHPSDKSKRVYTRTWDECPSLKIKAKRQCCYEEIDYAPIERRPRKPKTKDFQCKPLDLLDCKRFLKGYCPTIVLPGCRGVKKPHTCIGSRKPTGCKKICAPYPAFSECRHPPYNKRPPTECNCVTSTAMCHIWDLIRAGKLDFKPKIERMKID